MNQAELDEVFGMLAPAVPAPTLHPENPRPAKAMRPYQKGKGRNHYLVSDGRAQASVQDPLMEIVAKILLRHEESINVIRQNTGFMLWFMTPKDPRSILPLLLKASVAWKQSRDNGTDSALNRTSFRVVLMQCLVKALQDQLCKEDQLKHAQDQNWLTANREWTFQIWDVKAKMLKVDGTRSPIPHNEMLTKLQTLMQTVTAPEVVHRFRSTRPLRENMEGNVLPFLLDLGLTSPPAMDAQKTLRELTESSVFQVIGVQIRKQTLQRSQLATMLHQYLQGC